MGLIQRVRLLLDQASAKALTAEMGKAGKESGAALEKDVGGAMGRLKSMAMTVGAAIATALAVQKVIAFGKSVVMAAIESEAPWARLAQTLKGIGVDLDSVRGDVDKVVESLRATRFDDESIAETLGTLVQMTGDYARSLGAVSVVADLAAAKHLDLDTAAMLVGKAMNGNVELLQRYGIVVAKGADGLEALRTQFRGFAEAEGKTMAGQVDIAKVAWDDFKEALGGALLTAGDGISIVESLTRSIRGLVDILDVYSLAAKHAKEIQLGEVQERLAGLKGLPGITPVWGEGGTMTTAATERSRLLVIEKELTAELNAQARAHTAALRASHEGADAASAAAQTRRDAEAAAASKKAAEELAKLARDRASAAFEEAEHQRRAFAPFEGAWASRGTKPLGDMSDVPGASRTFGKDGLAPDRNAVPADLSEGIAESVAAGLRTLADHPPEVMLTGWKDMWQSLAGSSTNIAASLADAWAGAFERMREDGATLGNFFEGLGRSIFRSLTQGFSMYATRKVAENIAEGFEMLAKAAKYTAEGVANPFDLTKLPAAALATSSAHAFFLSAAKWGILGGASAAAGGLGATSAGGLGSGYATGAGTREGVLGERHGNDLHLHIDGVDPGNPRHADLVGATYEQYRERYGGDVYLNGRRVG